MDWILKASGNKMKNKTSHLCYLLTCLSQQPFGKDEVILFDPILEVRRLSLTEVMCASSQN